MRHLTKSNKTLAAGVVIVGAVALLMATVAFASTPKSSTVPDRAADRSGKQIVLGTITSFTPSSAVAGGGPFFLDMAVSPNVAAVPTWTADWDGPSGHVPLSVVATSTTSVSVAVPASAVLDPGSVTVTLSDESTAWSGTYSVTSAAPHVDTISPTSIAAGSTAFTLRVNGSNFATGANPAYVTFNDTPLVAATPTGPVNPTAILYATVPTTALFTPGSATVRVVNPNSGSGTQSNAVTFSILGPTFADIAPKTGANTDSALAFTISGTDLALAGAPRAPCRMRRPPSRPRRSRMSRRRYPAGRARSPACSTSPTSRPRALP
jgi:hypothetical protein